MPTIAKTPFLKVNRQRVWCTSVIHLQEQPYTLPRTVIEFEQHHGHTMFPYDESLRVFLEGTYYTGRIWSVSTLSGLNGRPAINIYKADLEPR